MSFDLRIRDGDIPIGSDGDFEKVENTDKLIQDLLKIILTPLGSNKFHPGYGCVISRSLIGQAFDFEMMARFSNNHIQNSIEYLQKLQQIQSNSQEVTPSELIAAIKHTDVRRNPSDLRFFEVIVQVLSRAMSIVETNLNLRPGL